MSTDPSTDPAPPAARRPSADWAKGYLTGVAAGGLAAMAGGLGACAGCAAAGVSPDWGLALGELLAPVAALLAGGAGLAVKRRRGRT